MNPRALEYLTELKKRAPNLKETEALRNELNRRAGEGASIDQVLTDAANYSEVAAGAADAIQPELDMLQVGADEERSIAESTAKRLRDAIARTYGRERENDAFARQGIRSGARSGFLADEEFRATSDVENDLGQKLSFIARRLAPQKQQLQQKQTSLVDTMRQQLLGGPAARQSEQLAGQSQALDVQAKRANLAGEGVKIFDNPFLLQTLPDNLLRQLLESYGYNVTD